MARGGELWLLACCVTQKGIGFRRTLVFKAKTYKEYGINRGNHQTTMKILQVTNGFPPTARAGVEQYTYLLSRTLRDSGHDVQVLCREEAHTLPERTILEDTVDGIPVRRVVNNFFDVVRFEQYYQNEGITTIFLETVEEMQPDIIHFQHAIGLSLTMLEAATETKIPFLLTLHDYWFICPIVQLLTTNLELCSGPHLGADCFDCMGPVDGFTRNVHRLPVYAQLKKVCSTALLLQESLRLLTQIQRPFHLLYNAWNECNAPCHIVRLS